MILWVLIGIFLLFLISSLLRERLYKKSRIKLCSICVAVSITWVILIILKLTGFKIDNLIIGILMGESITGIMYLFENKVKESKKNSLLWLKIIIIILGTLFVYTILTNGFDLNLIIVSLISLFLFLYIYKRLKWNDKPTVTLSHSKFKKEIEKLEERFEHCCD